MSEYRFEALLGAGAFGKVYRARMTGPDGFERAVAVKILHTDRVEPDEIRRLRDEARLLGLLHHRAIVQVLELFEMDDGWAVVMELVGGVDLSRVVAAGPIPATVAIELIAEAASALDAAVNTVHDGRPLRLVHRDIKPANLRLTPAGELKILDFGIARADFGTREALTETDQVLGTLRYMAPERFEGLSEPAGDVYALGIVGAQLLGARLGKMGLIGAEAHERRVESSLAPVVAVHGPGIGALLTRMLDARPERRPAAAEVSIHCRRLLQAQSGPSLEEWARTNVPRLASTEPPAEDGRLGSRMSSGSLRRQEPSGSATVGWLTTLGMVGSSGLFLGALGLLVLALAAVATALWMRPVPPPPAWDLELERIDLPRRQIRWLVPLATGGSVYAHDERCYLDREGRPTLLISPPDGVCARPTPTADGGRVALWVDGSLWQWSEAGLVLLRDQAIPLAWSPDGERLAYLATDAPDGDGKVARARLRTRSADGTRDAQALDDRSVVGAIWTPDGSGLLAWTQHGDWVRTLPSGSTSGLVPGVPVRFTPDGQSVIALGGSADRPELTQRTLGPGGLPGGGSRLLTTLSGQTEVSTAPDGSQTRVLVRGIAYAHDLWTFDGDVLASQEALRPPPGSWTVLPAAQGYALIGEVANPGRPGEARSAHHAIDLWDGVGESEALFRFDGEIHSIGLGRGGNAAIWHQVDPPALIELPLHPGAEPRTLVDLRGLDLRDLRLSPDARRIALLDADQRLVVADVAADLARAIAEAPADSPSGWSPRDWLPTGEVVATDAEGQVGIVDPDTREVRVVAQGVTYATALDARRLVLSHPAGTDLLDLDTGRRARVIDRQASFAPFGDGARAVVRQELHTEELFRAELVPATP